MLMIEKVEKFINNLEWNTQIESGNRYAIVYNYYKMDISDTQFRGYANKLGYSVACNNGADFTITIKG